jgi:hypothetical protein
VGLTPKTLYRWVQDSEFSEAYRNARRAAFGQCTARLQQAAGAAATLLLKIVVDGNAPASARVRAADLVLTHGAKAIELEDLEARVTELEGAVEENREYRRR